MLDEQTFVEIFDLTYYDDFVSELKERKQKLTDKLIESEEFMNWFNEDFAADRWISFVSMSIDKMHSSEITNMLVDYGLDNSFDLCKMIGVFEDVDNINTNKILWHIIDHWYTYTYVVNKFKRMYEEKKTQT
jgi:hypothetical protein